MKRFFILPMLLLCATVLSAQTPQKFSFQGVARDAQGKILSIKSVTVRTTIRQGTAAGLNVYSETHGLQTNANGVFNLNIGAGSNINGVFSQIAWSKNEHFLHLEIDVEGGNNFTDLGTTQLLSVPYALHAKEASQWIQDYPIVQSGKTNVSPPMISVGPEGSKLIWYPRKAAFRAGDVTDNAWNDENIGLSSFAGGTSSIAKGDRSVAFGSYTQALGDASFSHGVDAKSLGAFSFSMGFDVTSKAQNAFSIGSYNNISDNPTSSQQPTDRIFQIGNGNSNNRSNALTVLRNGRIAIGNNGVEPEFLLDIGGRARIKHNGSTAGLYFDNSANSPQAFMGMMNDQQIGFYLNNLWRFWVNGQGNAFIGGTLSQNSDRRLKRDFSPISESLGKLSNIQGYHYFWKDTLKDQTIQTGLIAQDIETLFPELVQTDEKGFKSVNYVGLIPHLIEAVKELQRANGILKSGHDDMLRESQKTNEAVKTLEAKFDKLLSNLSPPLMTVSKDK